jgi:hypothetical protein
VLVVCPSGFVAAEITRRAGGGVQVVRAWPASEVHETVVFVDPSGPLPDGVDGEGAAVVRSTWVFGPGDRRVERFASLARRLPFVLVPANAGDVVQPVWVGDVADAVLAATPGTETYVAGPETITIRAVAQLAVAATARRRPMLRVAGWRLATGSTAEPSAPTTLWEALVAWLAPEGIDPVRPEVSEPAVADEAGVPAPAGSLGIVEEGADEGLDAHRAEGPPGAAATEPAAAGDAVIDPSRAVDPGLAVDLAPRAETDPAPPAEPGAGSDREAPVVATDPEAAGPKVRRRRR